MENNFFKYELYDKKTKYVKDLISNENDKLFIHELKSNSHYSYFFLKENELYFCQNVFLRYYRNIKVIEDNIIFLFK